MRVPPEDVLYLRHMQDAILRIQSYVEGFDLEAFLQAPLHQDAVVRQLQIVGEASNKLSDGLRDSTPSVPWRTIRGMRNRITHDYIGVDLRIVWKTVDESLPGLLQEVQQLIARFEAGSNGA